MSTENSEILKTLLPYLLGTALVTATLVLGILRFTGGGGSVSSFNDSHMVQFDVVKYSNAQRAIASAYLKDANNDNSTLLLDLSKKTHESIDKYAKGRMVVLKQAIVQSTAPDITDAVLKDLGLPTNVPTQDPSTYALDVAPTMFIVKPEAAGGARTSANLSGANVLP